jgi:ABC-type multidrug transport system ATPase subunit/ABC-type multidrug transport system permease subunit
MNAGLLIPEVSRNGHTLTPAPVHSAPSLSELPLEIRDVSIRFGTFTAVDHVSLTVEPGEVFGLLGPNGSGKTTLIRAVCGLIPLAGGEAYVLGENVGSNAERIRARVGYMSQKFALYSDLTVTENMDFYAGIYGLSGPETRRRKEELIELVGLGSYLDRRAGRLSGGWKQRLAMVCSLLHRPRLVFLDEPTAGVDPVARRELWDLLFQLAAKGITLVVTTHYMDEAERCRRVGYLYNSRLLAVGTPGELKDLPTVTPPGTHRLEIAGSNTAELLARLRGETGVHEATIFGEAIHALVDQSFSAENLERNGLRVRPAGTNLEDVFVSLARVQARVPEALHPIRVPQPGPAPPRERLIRAVRTAQPIPAASFWRRLVPVARKEVLHILRDPMTLFFTLVIPILELFMLGYAIDTNVRHVRTVILDQAGTQESRQLLQKFENSDDFTIVARVFSDVEMSRAIVAGKARVGVKIPSDYSARLQAGQAAQVLILVDGSESSVAAEALNVGNAIALRESLERTLGDRALPVDSRPRVLFNPDTRSANFFIPGLMVVLCQMMATMLAATAIVREKETGTLEQLFMTPVRSWELVVGKMAPYLVLTFAEFCIIALFMITFFGVPVHGSFLTLLVLMVPFVLTMLGFGLLISTRASTRDAAMQMAMGTVLPAVFLSGYVFPIDSMPLFFRWFSLVVPTTWLVDASRGVILRGTGAPDLWIHAVVLWVMALVSLVVSSLRFRKQVA